METYFLYFLDPSLSYFLCYRNYKDWNQVSNNVRAGDSNNAFVILDLDPATWYNLRVTAHNNAGFSVAEYEFATLTITGGKKNLYYYVFFAIFVTRMY